MINHAKQFYRSFSNINYGSIIGGGHMLEGKMVSLDGNQWLEGRFLLTSADHFYIVRA